MISKILRGVRRHKVITAIALLLIIGGGYFGYKALKGKASATSYVLAAVEKGTLISSISGSGQVSVLNQVDIKPKVSGEIVAIYATPGQETKAGMLLVQIDTADAGRAVRDAQTALETAKLELDKFLEPADALTLLQAENSLIQAKESKQNAQDNLAKAYEDGFNTVTNTFLNLPTVMAGLQSLLFSNDVSLGGGSQWNIDFYAQAVQVYNEKALDYKNDAYEGYQLARQQYDQNFADYKSASRFSDTATIEKLITQTYETTKTIAEAVKSANNLIQFYKDKLIERNFKPQALADTHLSSLNSYTGTTNSYLSSLLGSQRAIQDDKDAIISAERSIEERILSLAKTKAAPDDLDMRAKKIAIQQKEDALTSARQSLADCYVRAPFSGVVAKVSAKKGDSASSGTSLVTIISKQKLAETSLNEVDIAKVKVGQKATLSFDAIEGFSITGEVAELDTIGTVTQGVVSYNVKISFDIQDERIKPGMSLSAAIIIDVKQDALVVPNSAVKRQGDAAYVEIVDENSLNSATASVSGVVLASSPQRQSVETGLSNDTMTEILSGLKEGDRIVTQTIATNTSTLQTQSQGSTGFRIPGLGGGSRD